MSVEGVGIVAGVGAAAGLGILVVGGIMWVGQKMEENYTNACKEWTDAYDAARAQSRANVQEIQSCFNFQLVRMALAEPYTPLDDPEQEAPRRVAEQKELEAALAQARTALDDASSMRRLKDESERTVLVMRLKREIANGRDVLPQADISAGEAALNGSPDAMRQALQRLRTAWNAVKDVEAQRAYQSRQAQLLFDEVAAQLRGLDTMIVKNAAIENQRQQIEQKLSEGRLYLVKAPAEALRCAEDAQQGVRDLADYVSAETFAGWDKTRKRINKLQGVLASLRKMVDEAVMLKLTTAQTVSSLTQRITSAQHDTQSLLSDSSPRTQQRLTRLSERVELLKQEVFSSVKKQQQHDIAQKVATTMAELGFQASSGGTPTLIDNGDVLRIEAIREGTTPNFERDEKLVSFDISREGDINYDFSGYVGEACTEEADRIFDALRKKGIYIVDRKATAVLKNVPTAHINRDVLQQEQFNPQLAPNKPQALLVERLVKVLERMNYSTIKQTSIGGTIELEAFQGTLGYRITLSPEGAVQVYKGASQIDVSEETDDPIVAQTQQNTGEVSQVIENAEKKAAQKVLAAPTYVQPKAKQMLGN